MILVTCLIFLLQASQLERNKWKTVAVFSLWFAKVYIQNETISIAIKFEKVNLVKKEVLPTDEFEILSHLRMDVMS